MDYQGEGCGAGKSVNRHDAFVVARQTGWEQMEGRYSVGGQVPRYFVLWRIGFAVFRYELGVRGDPA